MPNNEKARALANRHAGPKSLPKWMERSLRGDGIRNKDGSTSTIRSVDFGTDDGFYIAPTIRKIDGKFIILTPDEAVEQAMQKDDAFGPFKTTEEATAFSKKFSSALRSKSRSSDMTLPDQY